MNGALHAFQAAFVRDLLRPIGAAHGSRLAEQPGFAIYRNTVLAGCIDALAANYPTVRQLVGADCFAAAARAFALETPPQCGRLGEYGEGFAGFLSTLDGVSELAYLPDVAALDRCWTEAHFAADAPVLQAGDLAGLAPEQFGLTRLRPHPAARWKAFGAMPIYTLWRRHREHLPLGDDLPWRGESALLTRPAGAVLWAQLPADAVVFMDGCAAGQTFAEAAAAGDPAAWLPQLIGAGAFTGFRGGGK